jgi:hypothetical protein
MRINAHKYFYSLTLSRFLSIMIEEDVHRRDSYLPITSAQILSSAKFTIFNTQEYSFGLLPLIIECACLQQ